MDLSDLALWKPLIAAVNGHCLGAGLEVALQCDLRIASSQRQLRPARSRPSASIPAVSGLHRLLKAVPSAHAMQMALTGERIDAAGGAAHRARIRCGRTPQRCASAPSRSRSASPRNAPLAVQAIKKLSRQTSHLSEADAQQLTELYWGVLRDTQDRIEGRARVRRKTHAPLQRAAERPSSIEHGDIPMTIPQPTALDHRRARRRRSRSAPRRSAMRRQPYPTQKPITLVVPVRPGRRQRHPGARASHRACRRSSARPWSSTTSPARAATSAPTSWRARRPTATRC